MDELAGGALTEEGQEIETEAPTEEGQEKETEAAPEGQQKKEPKPSEPDYRRAVNEAARAARITAERETAERTKKAADEEIAAQQIPDPYNPGRCFQSVEDIRAYGQRLRADAEKTSVDAIRQRDADRKSAEEYRRKVADEAKRNADTEARRAFIAADAQAFRAQYPDVNLQALDNDQSFREFCGTRYGVEPLGDLYASYIKLTGGRAKAAAARAESRTERGTGAGAGDGGVTLTASQQAELDAWNREFPDMKMTKAEYLKM